MSCNHRAIGNANSASVTSIREKRDTIYSRKRLRINTINCLNECDVCLIIPCLPARASVMRLPTNGTPTREGVSLAAVYKPDPKISLGKVVHVSVNSKNKTK